MSRTRASKGLSYQFNRNSQENFYLLLTFFIAMFILLCFQSFVLFRSLATRKACKSCRGYQAEVRCRYVPFYFSNLNWKDLTKSLYQRFKVWHSFILSGLAELALKKYKSAAKYFLQAQFDHFEYKEVSGQLDFEKNDCSQMKWSENTATLISRSLFTCWR